MVSSITLLSLVLPSQNSFPTIRANSSFLSPCCHNGLCEGRPHFASPHTICRFEHFSITLSSKFSFPIVFSKPSKSREAFEFFKVSLSHHSSTNEIHTLKTRKKSGRAKSKAVAAVGCCSLLAGQPGREGGQELELSGRIYFQVEVSFEPHLSYPEHNTEMYINLYKYFYIQGKYIPCLPWIQALSKFLTRTRALLVLLSAAAVRRTGRV